MKKKHIDLKTGLKFTIDKNLDKIKSVKTASNKVEELKKATFVITM